MSIHAERAKFWLFSILLAFVALAPAWSAADDRQGLHRPFDGIVVFGDSLSDPGNAFALTGENLTPPSYGMSGLELLTLVPDAPYAKGGNHFSNGPTWIEDLGRSIGLADIRARHFRVTCSLPASSRCVSCVAGCPMRSQSARCSRAGTEPCFASQPPMAASCPARPSWRWYPVPG